MNEVMQAVRMKILSLILCLEFQCFTSLHGKAKMLDFGNLCKHPMILECRNNTLCKCLNQGVRDGRKRKNLVAKKYLHLFRDC